MSECKICNEIKKEGFWVLESESEYTKLVIDGENDIYTLNALSDDEVEIEIHFCPMCRKKVR